MKIAMFLDDLEAYNLQFLRYFYVGEDLENIRPHDAKSDVIVLQNIFEILFHKMKDRLALKDDNQVILKMHELSCKHKHYYRMPFGKYKKEKIIDIAKKDLSYLEYIVLDADTIDVDLKNSIKETAKIDENQPYVFTNTKYKGKTVAQLFIEDQKFLKWINDTWKDKNKRLARELSRFFDESGNVKKQSEQELPLILSF